MRKNAVALLALILAFAAQALAGTLVTPLGEMVATGNPAEKIGVVVAMADMVDNEALNADLKNRQVTLAERHYEVITTLQAKATSTQGPVLALLAELETQGQVEKVRNFWISNMIAFRGTPEAINRVASLDDVDKIYFDFPVESIEPIRGGEAPPLIAGHTNGLDVIHAPQVWAMGYTGAGRIVSNIDTGVDGTHPALSARWRGNNGHPASECWKDPVQNTSTPTDDGQHGTHTMGTICGRSATGAYDTIGVAINAQWIAAGAIDDGSTTAQIIECFQWLADPDGNPGTTSDVPDAVGNSWGWSPIFHGVPPCDQTFWSAIDGCENAGVVVVFSAGNEGDDAGDNSLRTPADRATTYNNAFSVGAVDGHTAGYPIAYFSSLGPCECATGDMSIKPECVAPGVNVYSSIPGGGYAGDWSGTSMASPHVTGSVAILRQVNPNLDVDAIKAILMQTSVDLPAPGNGEDNTFGHGVIDLYAAVQMAMTGYGFADGYVRDAGTNAPLQATVSVVGAANQVTANGSGYYIMGLPADTTFTLRAGYFGYTPVNHSVPVVANDTTSQNFLLSPAPSAILQGTVTSAQGGPIVGASVTVLNTPLAPTTTNSSGFYQFPSIPVGHNADVRVQMVGYSQGSGTIVIQTGTNVLNFQLQPAESFESTNGGYTGTGLWEWGVPTSGPNAAHSGVKLWATVLGGDYLDDTDDSLRSREYAITGANARLEFYHWYSFEPSYDGGNVSISTNGGATWTLLTPDGGYPDASVTALGEPGYTSTSDWALASFDISSYLGQTVKFMWRFGSDVSIVSSGWYIDDVAAPGSSAPLPPNITYNPTSFNVQAAPGQVETRPLNIGNNGAGNLNFSLSTATFNLILNDGNEIPVKIAAEKPSPVDYVSIRTKAGVVDQPIYPPVITGSGGPDAFGHTWIDSDEPGGPPVTYVDISGVGTPITLADDNYLGPFDIGFSFPYFENSYSQLYIGSNGYVSFGAGYGSNVYVGIPSAGTPNNFIAAMWEDVNPAAGGAVRYYYDTTNQRFIVSFDDVLYWTPSGNVGSLDFQILLYASGKIEMNYGTLNPGTHNLTTNTVGIENAGGADGLQIAYNAAYLHSNLSIRIASGWLFAAPTGGNVVPGGNTSATITFDAGSLNIGVYTGNINLDSNDPETPAIDIPVTFNVGTGGTPNIIVSPTTVRDTLIEGQSAAHGLKIKNTGTGTLAVSFADSAAWIISPGGSSYVSPGDSVFREITLDASAVGPGTYNATVWVNSNDPDSPHIPVAVTLFIPAPNIAVNPTSINDTLAQGGIATHNLTISNTGAGLLNFNATTSINPLLALDNGAILPLRISQETERTITRFDRPSDIAKEYSSEPAYPPQILNQGGPDAFGYRWIDSDEPGGPAYNWVDISAFGTPITGLGDDTNIGPFPIGFSFPFYGANFTDFRFCTNGFVSFTSIMNSYDNLAIPSTSAPLDMVAVMWDDMYFPGGGAAYYYSNNVDSLVVSWIDVPHYYAGGPYTYQLILSSNGIITYQYQTISAPDSSATVGIQNGAGADGLQVVHKAIYLHNNLAVRITSSWLAVSPTSGSVNPGGQTQLAVTLDAASLAAGVYTGAVVIGSNDPDTPTINVPVTLRVQGAGPADIAVSPMSISDTLAQGAQTVFPLRIRNVGASPLIANLGATEFSAILSAESETPRPAETAKVSASMTFKDDSGNEEILNVWLFIAPATANIAPGDSLLAQVTLNAGTIGVGNHTGQVTITSNDPDEATVNIPVSLLVTATGAPEISLSRTAFVDTIYVDSAIVRYLYVSNTGSATLYYGVHDNRTWISVVPDTGIVPASLVDTIAVTFNASTLTPGTYAGQVNVNANDADEGLTVLPVTLLVREPGSGGCDYMPGDINGNGQANGIDVVYGVTYLKGGATPRDTCDCRPFVPTYPFYGAMDVNGNCQTNGIDITYFVAFLKGLQPALQWCDDCPPANMLAPAIVNPQKGAASATK